ncbi:MAG: autotransporter assembly complex family protein [Halioglobus sp.]
MKRLCFTGACYLLFVAGVAAAAKPVLDYELNGISGELLENAQIYLGSLPVSEDERDNFLFAAEKSLQQSLNALGHYEAKIALDLDRSSAVWNLDIAVEPGPRVKLAEVDIRIEGAASEDPAFAELLERNPLQPGAGLQHEVYEDFKAELQNLARERGYFAGELTHHRVVVDPQMQEAQVQLYYQSGERFHFGQISWDEYPLSQRLLEQMQTFAPGDPFSTEALREFQADLQRTGYFGSALVRPQALIAETGEVPVKVELQEGDRNHYRVGLGFSTDTQQRVSLTWRTPRINSQGHSQESRIEYSPIRPQARVDYMIPLGNPLTDKLLVGARLEENEYGSLDSRQQIFSLRREYVRSNSIYSMGLRQLDEDWDLGPERLNNDYLLPGATYSHSVRSGNVLDPESGFSQLYGFEIGADNAGSDLDLARTYANLKGVYSFGGRHRLVGRAEFGAVFFPDKSRPDLAPSLSFFAGGAQSIRGYAYQSLGPTETVINADGDKATLVVGGDRLAIVSSEYQYYVTSEWRGTVFVDAGNAYNAGDFDPVVGAGVGVHYVSPVGAIRVDFANSVSENNDTWRVHLTIGAEF